MNNLDDCRQVCEVYTSKLRAAPEQAQVFVDQMKVWLIWPPAAFYSTVSQE